MTDHARQELAEAIGVLQDLLQDDSLLKSLSEVAQACVEALNSGHKILLAGNGGSAADAQHLAGELVGRLNIDRPGLSAIALSTDTSVLTAVANDYGYNKVFSRQVGVLGRPGDVFLAMSTSGRSPNILAALEECHGRGIVTVGLTGQDGDRLPELCDHCLRIPSTNTQRIQEGHLVVGHILCGLIEQAIYGAQT